MSIKSKASIGSFISGLGSIVDLGGTPTISDVHKAIKAVEVKSIPRRSDTDNLRSDWSNVGNDIRKAIGKVSTNE